jgi:hypothetical protein
MKVDGVSAIHEETVAAIDSDSQKGVWHSPL